MFIDLQSTKLVFFKNFQNVQWSAVYKTCSLWYLFSIFFTNFSRTNILSILVYGHAVHQTWLLRLLFLWICSPQTIDIFKAIFQIYFKNIISKTCLWSEGPWTCFLCILKWPADNRRWGFKDYFLKIFLEIFFGFYVRNLDFLDMFQDLLKLKTWFFWK